MVQKSKREKRIRAKKKERKFTGSRRSVIGFLGPMGLKV